MRFEFVEMHTNALDPYLIGIAVWRVFDLRYSIPQVWIDNSYQANPGNSCGHVHFFSARGTKNTGLHCQHVILPPAYTQPADQIVTMRSTLIYYFVLNRKCSHNNTYLE